MEFRTEKEIYAEAINDAVTRGLIHVDQETLQAILNGTYTANQYSLDLATHSFVLSKTEDKVRDLYNDINLVTATGMSLDNMGELVNVHRGEAKPAMVGITLSIPVATDSDITVPGGTRVLIDEVVPDSDMYVVREDIVISSGTTSANGVAVCIDNGFRNVVPVGTVRGVNGFSTVSATNTKEGVNGCDVEDDDNYRQRLMNWSAVLARGSRGLIEDYLKHYDGVDDYNLVPHYDGVGTLLIVCDTIESLLSTISSDVYADCMNITDFPPVCVLPESTTLASLTVSISIGENQSNLSEVEFVQLVTQQVKVFIKGGTQRNGGTYHGMGIGDDFVPSKLIEYLFNEFPELSNIVPSSLSTVSVDEDSLFGLDELSVVVV